MKHRTDKLDSRWFVGVLLFKVHNESESSILEGCVCGADDDRVPFAMSDLAQLQ